MWPQQQPGCDPAVENLDYFNNNDEDGISKTSKQFENEYENTNFTNNNDQNDHALDAKLATASTQDKDQLIRQLTAQVTDQAQLLKQCQDFLKNDLLKFAESAKPKNVMLFDEWSNTGTKKSNSLNHGGNFMIVNESQQNERKIFTGFNNTHHASTSSTNNPDTTNNKTVTATDKIVLLSSSIDIALNRPTFAVTCFDVGYNDAIVGSFAATDVVTVGNNSSGNAAGLQNEKHFVRHDILYARIREKVVELSMAAVKRKQDRQDQATIQFLGEYYGTNNADNPEDTIADDNKTAAAQLRNYMNNMNSNSETNIPILLDNNSASSNSYPYFDEFQNNAEDQQNSSFMTTERERARGKKYREAITKQIQTPRYIVQNSMNLKQYRHRPSHDSSQCFNLFPASAEKVRKTYRLRKRVFRKNFHAETIYNSFKQSYPVQKVSFQISSLLKNLLQKIQTTSKLPQSKERTSTILTE